MNKGIRYGISAYIIWGFLPIYWKQLKHVPAIELISHRILWSFFMVLLIVLVSRQWQAFQSSVMAPRILRNYILAAILIGINWLTYVWAVNSGFIVETSLGYFINPLFSVFLGVLFLQERLRPMQWVPIGLAGVGMLYLTIAYGSVPWISLTLATTFGLYGLAKKTAPINSVYGLSLETGILFFPALVYLIYSEVTGQAVFLNTSISSNLLLVGAGLVTLIPLLLFASAVQRVPLSSLGLLQYIAPSIQLLLGVLVYKEPFSQTQFIGFGIVWIALIIFWLEGFLTKQSRTKSSLTD